MRSDAASPAFRLSIHGSGDAGYRGLVERSGSIHLGRLGIGRTGVEAARLAALLFPVCPRAHSAAVLGAIERAVGLDLPVGQEAARTALVTAESLASGIMRIALFWPHLAGQQGDPAPVARARSASERLATALYGELDKCWMQPGGCHLTLDKSAIASIVSELGEALAELDRVSEAIISSAERVSILADELVIESLDHSIDDPKASPQTLCREETPRTFTKAASLPSTLSPWFAAQRVHLNRLHETLVIAVSKLCGDAPLTLGEKLSGVGLSVVMTARGRLRHAVELRHGRIENWTIAAPTDWNFAPEGPAAQLVSALAADDPIETSARWLVAALDPCLPCEVHRHA